MKEHNEISAALAPSDAKLFGDLQQKLNAWSSLGRQIVEQGHYTANQLLCAAGTYYQAAHGWLVSFEGSENSIIAQWSKEDSSIVEWNTGSTILTNWKERLGCNRAVFIPDAKVASQFLGESTAENVLGILLDDGEKPEFLMLLCNIEAKEESYCFLETACFVLYHNGQLSNNYVSQATENVFLMPPPAVVDESVAQKLAYFQIILSGCDGFYDVDLTKNTYQRFTADERAQGDYSQLVEYYASNLVHPDDKTLYLTYMQLENLIEMFQQGNVKKKHLTYRKKNSGGQYFWVNDIVMYMGQSRDDRGRAIIVSYHAENLRYDESLKEQELKFQREIHRKDEVYRIIGEHTKVSAFEWSRPPGEQGFSLSYISPELANEFQFYRKDIHLFTYLWTKNYIHPLDKERYQEFLKDPTRGPVKVVCRVTTDGYNYYWYQFTKRIIFNDAEREEHMIGTVLNVDEQTKAAYTLKRKARLDSLTGLLNQETFYTEAERLLKNNPKQEYAVVIMDIDNFKLVNSLYGMNAGNRVLAQIGQTLKGCLSKYDICARVYADVYYIVTKYKSDKELVNLLHKMMERLTYVEYSSLILPCFGISNSKASERNITLLCELASFAHKYSKGHTRERYTFYDVSIRQTIIEEKQMESEMEFALQSGQFKIYLQPKYVISTREVIGAEALVRWEHPVKGMIVPAKFISLFEKNGFIIRLDEYIWEQVCVLLNKWQTSGAKCIPISVNMSRLHLNNRDFKSTIVGLLEKYQINHKWFELELTENLLFENLNQMIEVLSDLQKQGFYINMDDFGSGYSSLNMLRNIPIDILKIDGNFFDEKMLTPKGKTIVKYVVSMAKELNMQVVAEGVENLSQEKFLLEVGCEIAQGFYFSKPLPVAAFESKYWHTK